MIAHGRRCGDGQGRLALWQSIELDPSSSLVCICLPAGRKLNRSRMSERKLGDGLLSEAWSELQLSTIVHLLETVELVNHLPTLTIQQHSCGYLYSLTCLNCAWLPHSFMADCTI